MSALWQITVLVAGEDKGVNPADVKPGWIAFVVFLLLAAATVLLWLSFRKQLRKIDFEEKPDETGRDDGHPTRA